MIAFQTFLVIFEVKASACFLKLKDAVSLHITTNDVPDVMREGVDLIILPFKSHRPNTDLMK